ncbi:MAG TPA: S9 family peptidase [Candidatus Limnocylindrales bacterium]|nr:S9 family peptidase [Candidatus Limnocylindrales bacterium]
MKVTPARPPVAAQRPHVLEAHGDRRVDPYYWLRERENPEVLAYLEAENAYTQAAMAPLADLEERLYREILDRVQETDYSAPTYYKGWWTYTRTVEGLDYEIYCRRRGSMDAVRTQGALPDAPEEVILDANELARGHDYFELGFVERSPDENLLAYAADYSGSELHDLRFRDLTTGQDLEDVIHEVYYGAAWAADSRTFFYVRPDSTMRPYQVWRHRLGTAVERDLLVLQENDERFELNVELSKSEAYIFITSGSQVTSDCRFLRSDRPDDEPALVEPRRPDIEYSVDHQDDRFLILTNDGAINFRLMAAPVSSPGRSSWTEVVPERPGVRLNFVDVHRRHAVLGQRSDGLERLEVLDSSSGALHLVEQPDAAYTAYPGSSPDYESKVMRFFYTSLTAPWSAVDYDMETRDRTIVKEQPVRGGYNREDYSTERIWAASHDGVRVPISLVYRTAGGARLPRLRRSTAGGGDGARPLLLYGYGAYEASNDPMFDPARLSLLDRGYIFAIAHVRGGGEMGREWYEEGRLMRKKNTFLDFIACAEHLVAEGYTASDRLCIRGRSAGGLLIGAVVNMRPDLFSCAVAQVPFVDALTTMLDDKLPLTVNEYDEWGDPRQPEFYWYIKSYSPYDNVRDAAYPALLVTGGLNDPRVSYWEPAKWVARLRTLNQSDRALLLKTQMGAGHMGPSGRYESWREEAFVMSFVISQHALD